MPSGPRELVFVLTFSAVTSAADVSAPSGASAGGFHGFISVAALESPHCAFEQIEGRLIARYNDSFGDTTSILDAFAIVITSSGDVRIPASGHFEIAEAFGNTTAVPGGSLPVLIGESGSTLSGLPGLLSDGSVKFRIAGYQIQPDDPDPLFAITTIEFLDLCDDPDTEGCPQGFEQISPAVAATSILVPAIELAVSASIDRVCAGRPTDVTYLYTLTNPGNTPLSPELTDDPPCEFPVFSGGDDNGDFLLDPGEAWTYECLRTVSEPTTNNAAVLAEAELPNCFAEAAGSVTIEACTWDLDGDCMIGLAEIVRILEVWGPCRPECPEDFNGDGRVGFADVLMVLAEWGPCS